MHKIQDAGVTWIQVLRISPWFRGTIIIRTIGRFGVLVSLGQILV